MNYGDILSRGWHITWNNKYLWVLGFLAALSRGASFNSNSNYSESGPASFEEMVPILTLILVLVCVGMIIGIALWLLSIAAKGGLISAVARIDNGETLTLGQAFQAGTARLGSLVGMNIVLYLPIILLLGLSFGAVIMLFTGAGISATAVMDDPNTAGEAVAASLGLFFVCFCLFFCILFLVLLLIQFVNAFAYRGIMLQEMGAVESIYHGWAVFRNNLAEILVLSIIFFVIGFAFGLAVLMLLAPLAIAVFLPLFGVMLTGGSVGLAEILYLAVGGLCLGLLGAALHSILVTWQSASFTLAYQEWINKPKVA